MALKPSGFRSSVNQQQLVVPVRTRLNQSERVILSPAKKNKSGIENPINVYANTGHFKQDGMPKLGRWLSFSSGYGTRSGRIRKTVSDAEGQ